MPPILHEAVLCSKWRVDQSFDFTAIDQVNIQEARASRAALKSHRRRNKKSEVVLDGTDSNVCLGASGLIFCSQIEQCVAQLYGVVWVRKTRLLQSRLVSEENPSDDPSRDKPLRLPQAAVGVVLGLVCPEKPPAIDLRDMLRQVKKLCLEFFSGVCRLTAAIKRLGLGVGEPWEAFSAKKVYLECFDLLLSQNIERCCSRFAQVVIFIFISACLAVRFPFYKT